MEKDIKDLTLEELSSPHLVPAIFKQFDGEERREVLTQVVELAKEYDVDKLVVKAINKYNKQNPIAKTEDVTGVLVELSTSSKGVPEPTIDNFIHIMENDDYIKNLFFYDEFSNSIICKDKGKTRVWQDHDDSCLMWYIEKNYNLFNLVKYYRAFESVLLNRKVHPIKNIIEEKPWDGTPRIDRFLTDILKCDDTNYSKEVSRMIFYGGISRLYEPGCKFDYMPILIGAQGVYKSSIVKWLALDEHFYTDVPSIEGKDGVETIRGAWMCEMAELLAMVKIKEVEAMKGFVTRTTDRYREAYGRRTSEFPRQCIFIGTTNDREFLKDSTGNRRYLPITVNLKPGELLGKIDAVKNYILECWREALVLYESGKTYLTIPFEHMGEVEEAQRAASEENPLNSLILDYLLKKKVGEVVSVMELHTKCLNGIKTKLTPADRKVINNFVNSLPEWERSTSVKKFKEYGVSRYWTKIKPSVLEMDNDLE